MSDNGEYRADYRCPDCEERRLQLEELGKLWCPECREYKK